MSHLHRINFRCKTGLPVDKCLQNGLQTRLQNGVADVLQTCARNAVKPGLFASASMFCRHFAACLHVCIPLRGMQTYAAAGPADALRHPWPSACTISGKYHLSRARARETLPAGTRSRLICLHEFGATPENSAHRFHQPLFSVPSVNPSACSRAIFRHADQSNLSRRYHAGSKRLNFDLIAR